MPAMNCTASCAAVKMFWSGPLPLRAERVLVQPYDRRLPRPVVNRNNIEPARAFADAAFRKKALRRANYDVLCTPGNAELRQGGRVLSHSARTNLNKCEGLAVVADQVDFALRTSRHIISCYKHVPSPP